MVEADVLQNNQSTDICADSVVTETDLSKAVPYLIILSVCSVLEVITKLLPKMSWGIYTPLYIDLAVIFGYVFVFLKLKPYSKYFGILVYVAAATVIMQEVNSEIYYNLYVKIPLYISIQALAITKYKLISDGFKYGNIQSYDGYYINLDDTYNFKYDVFDILDKKIISTCNVDFKGKYNIINYRNYAINNMDYSRFRLEDDKLTSLYINPNDGINYESIKYLTSYSKTKSLVDIVLETKYIYINNEFNENNINHVYFKGSVLSKIYDDSAIRTRGDIDLYVSSKDLDKAKKALIEGGFTFESGDSMHDIHFMKNDIDIDI